MHRAFKGLVLFSLVFIGQSIFLQAEEAATTFKVVSWNLEWFPGRAPKSSQAEKDSQVAAVQAALAEIKPDILLLQEIRNEDAAKLALAKLPELKLAVFSKFDGDQQVA